MSRTDSWLLDEHAVGDPEHPPAGKLSVVVAQPVAFECFQGRVPRPSVELDDQAYRWDRRSRPGPCGVIATAADTAIRARGIPTPGAAAVPAFRTRSRP